LLDIAIVVGIDVARWRRQCVEQWRAKDKVSLLTRVFVSV